MIAFACLLVHVRASFYVQAEQRLEEALRRARAAQADFVAADAEFAAATEAWEAACSAASAAFWAVAAASPAASAELPAPPSSSVWLEQASALPAPPLPTISQVAPTIFETESCRTFCDFARK
jgi:hypothetical protein